MLHHGGIRSKWCSVNYAIRRIVAEDVSRKIVCESGKHSQNSLSLGEKVLPMLPLHHQNN